MRLFPSIFISRRFATLLRLPTLIVGLAIGHSIPGYSADISIDDIRTAVREELGSIHSFAAHANCMFKTKLTAKAHKDAEGSAETEWVIQGVQKLRRMSPRLFANRKWGQVWRSFDGETSFQADFDSKDPKLMQSVAKTAGNDRRDWGGISPEVLLGLELINTNETLLTLLDRSDVVFVGNERLQDEDTIHLNLGTVEEALGTLWNFQVWLGVQRNLLPVKIVRRAVADAPANNILNVPDMSDTITIIEWENCEDSQLHRTRQFPRRATVETILGTTSIELTDVKFNVLWPKSKFQIEPVVGTVLSELRFPNDPNRTRTIVGGIAALEAKRRTLVKQARADAATMESTSSQSVDATPNEWSGLSILNVTVAMVAGIAICILTVMHVAQRRTSG